jgi:hypothetical protein
VSADDPIRLDLSGDWDGIYSYTVPLPPVSFTARLSEQQTSLGGAIEEERDRRKLVASIEGRRIGVAVTFLKRYEDRAIHHDVEYEGEVSPDGAEISGRWSIYGDWSGPFLMVRRPRKAVARLRRTGAQSRP